MSVNILGAAADVFIAACLFYYLRRSRTGFKRYTNRTLPEVLARLIFPI